MHLAQAYTRAMQQQGHTTAHAFAAQQALDEANQKKPDVVVLELQLPGPNGVAFLQEFRSYLDWSNIPVVVHSYALPNSQQAVHDALKQQLGVVKWLYKPQTTLSQLQLVLESYGGAS